MRFPAQVNCYIIVARPLLLLFSRYNSLFVSPLATQWERIPDLDSTVNVNSVRWIDCLGVELLCVELVPNFDKFALGWSISKVTKTKVEEVVHSNLSKNDSFCMLDSGGGDCADAKLVQL